LPNQQARDTIFTSLDMEYGFLSNDKKEAEQQLRVFVGTKQGSVYIVNFEKCELEKNGIHKTNDAAIYSIAVTEGFCVIGS
jgi:hypothetical protein